MTHLEHVADSLTQWWTSLESGWQAVLLGLIALTLVYLGISIPW